MQQALSRNENFNFLQISGDIAEIKTPLEANSRKVASFAEYTTGTLELAITPDLVDALAHLRETPHSSEFKKLAQFIQELQLDFPTQNGCLTTLINPTWLATHVPFCESPKDVTEEMLARSKWNIELTADFALIDSVPVWERLDGERTDFFNLFKLYRDARYGMLDSGDYVICTRSIAGLARRLNLPTKLLTTISHIYNWATRCAYYDRFFEMEIARRKQKEIMLLQRDHLKFSTTLLDKAMCYFEKHADCLTPKDAIAMAELGFKYSRLSVGLQHDKPGTPGDVQAQPILAINLNHQTNDNSQNVQIGSFASAVDRQLRDDLKDTDNLISILNVLQKSGAMNTAITGELNQDKVVDAEIITAD